MNDIVINTFYYTDVRLELANKGYSISDEHLHRINLLIQAVTELYFEDVISITDVEKIKEKILRKINEWAVPIKKESEQVC